MAHELHKAGYQHIRILPFLSPSGSYWRCWFTHSENVADDGYTIIDEDWDNDRGIVAKYTSGQDNEFFGWKDAKDFNARQLARLFLERFPAIAEKGEGLDWAYAGWLTDVLGEAEAGPEAGGLVYLMQDWEHDTRYLRRWLPPPKSGSQAEARREADMTPASQNNSPSSLSAREAFSEADRVSITDQVMIEKLLRDMVAEAGGLAGRDYPSVKLAKVAAKWARLLSPDNEEFIHTMTAGSLAAFLRSRGYAETSLDDYPPLEAMLMHTISQCLHALSELSSGKIGEKQASFWADAAIEDCFMFLQGKDNPAD